MVDRRESEPNSMLQEPVMTSPPDRDLAARILERAQMAQMKRKLKLGLSQVPTSSHTYQNGHTGKKDELNDKKTNLDNTEHPPLRPLETRKRITAIPQDSKDTSPLKKHASANLKINKDLSKKNKFAKPKSPAKNKDIGSIPAIKVPSTPGRSSSSSNNNIQTTPNRRITRLSHGDDNNNNDISNTNSTGADLLIYLATSPYTKNESTASTRIKIPTTPRTSTFGQLTADDTIRLSHLKPSLTSPQSTLKNIHHNANGDILGGNVPNMPFNNMLLESPSLYNSNGTLAPNTGINNNNANLHLNTSSNVNASGFNPNLLKTPNFNMGDYIHNLFSPSPNVNLNNITKERSIGNIKRNSISNSLAQVALLSTSGITSTTNANSNIIDGQISTSDSNGDDNNKNSNSSNNNANINDNNNI